MKSPLIIATLVALALFLGAQTSETQTWTSIDGRVVQAKFVRIDGQSLLIEKDGAQFIVLMAKLSAESAAEARRLQEKADAALSRTEPDFGPKVLTFCRANMGRKVGDGQCATLAVEALTAAGAAGMGQDAPGAGDFVWGKPVAVIETTSLGVKGFQELPQVKPGDIVQFRNVRLEGASHDGRSGIYWMDAFHHTAIVADVDPAHAILKVYQQNWGPKKEVRLDTMHLADLAKGWLRIYRPLPGRR